MKNPEIIAQKRVPHAQEYFSDLKYETDPNGRYRVAPNQTLPHISINHLGYRGRPFSGEETILLMGDSVTFGVGADDDDQRVACHLAQLAQAPVADASVRAYRISQHYAQFPRLLALLPHLKHVILWGGFADLLFWSISGGSVEGAFQFEKKYTPYTFPEKVFKKLFGATSLNKVRGAHVLNETIPQQGRSSTGVVDLAQQMILYTESIENIARSRNMDVYFILQPFFREPPQEPVIRQIMDFYDAKTKDKCGIGWYEAAHQLVRRLSSELDRNPFIHFIDAQEWVDQDDFLDQVHLNPDGHLKVATQLSNLSLWEGRTIKN